MCCDAGTPSFCLLSFHLLKYSFSGYHGKLITHYGRSSLGDGTKLRTQGHYSNTKAIYGEAKRT